MAIPDALASFRSTILQKSTRETPGQPDPGTSGTERRWKDSTSPNKNWIKPKLLVQPGSLEEISGNSPLLARGDRPQSTKQVRDMVREERKFTAIPSADVPWPVEITFELINQKKPDIKETTELLDLQNRAHDVQRLQHLKTR